MPKAIKTEEWLRRAKVAHSDRYDYSESIYVDSETKITIVCREHGPFNQNPSSHNKGHGCPKCKAERIGNVKRGTLEGFIKKAREIHGDGYDYPEQVYKNVMTHIKIRCAIHGEFEQTPHAHLAGKGCDRCGGKVKLSDDQMLSRFIDSHGDRYDYSKVVFGWASRPVEIVCKLHGSFWQIPSDHWSGCGCPACSNQQSVGEGEIAEWLLSLGVVVERRTRAVIAPREIDIWLPEHNVGIEYHGLYWHTEDRVGNLHAKKYNLAKAAGIRLIQVFEDEWCDREHAVKQVILSAIGRNTKRVMARKCLISTPTRDEARAFMCINHVQGVHNVGECYGLVVPGGELVAVMIFTKATSGRGGYGVNVWELARYATSCSVAGGASRLMRAFLANHPGAELVSYVDHRYFDGGMYSALGFTKKVTATDYEYLFHKRRVHKSRLQKRELAKLLGDKYDPSLTEREMATMIGAKRILNAGRTTYFRGAK